MGQVQVNYKSGASVVFKCKNFKITHRHGEVISFEGDSMKPGPLFMGMENIESVWEL